MSAPKWPVVLTDEDGDAMWVSVMHRHVLVSIVSDQSELGVILTQAQSATLRAALEAAEKEMSC